jgi:2-hydroxy-3-oxopropionate reductase
MPDTPHMETIGFIGLGLMGRPMATNLLKAGYTVIVHNRSSQAVDALEALGAMRGKSPADIARQATRIITMLPDSPDVEQVLEGTDGVFGAMQRGTILIDNSSISPAVARRLAAKAKSLGAQMLDAPVSGGEIGAVSGTLSIMVGGDADAFNAVKPILDVMGNPDKVVRIGDAGAGQLCKVCNQMVIAGTLAVVAEAFALAKKSGIDAAKMREALLGGFAASRVLEVHGERILTGNFKPGFKTKLFAKDLKIAASTLVDNNVAAPVVAIAQQEISARMAAGAADEDYSGMAKVILDLARLD